MTRNRAPLRPRRPATTIPDFLFALGTAALTMGAVFFAATFGGDELVAGETGRILARFFAGALAVSALLLFALGIVLLRDDRGRADHYRVPIAVGVVVGLIEGWLFILAAGGALAFPPLLLLFALRPFRRMVSNIVPGGSR